MTVRQSIKCSSCEKIYTLRITLGHKEIQEHTFHCYECGELIYIKIDLDLKNALFKISEFKNCVTSKDEGLIMNLNPEAPVSKDFLHQDKMTPWMFDIINDFDLRNEKSIFNISNDVYQNITSGFNFNNWISIKKCWKFYLKGNEKLLKKFLTNYDNKDNIEDGHFIEYLYDFIISFYFPGKKGTFDKCLDLFNKCKKDNRDKLITYRKQGKTNFDDFIKKGFQIFSEYFLNYNLYEPVLLYLKNNIKLRDELIVTSVDFEKIKMFYGNCFEYFTDIIEVMVCLNNIAQGREYDTFEDLTLKKYRSLDKSSRLNPLKSYNFYNDFLNKFDNQLRNASHHGAIEYDEDSDLIKFVHGKGDTESTMSYLEYLIHCNEIFLNTCVVLSVSMIVFY